MGVVQRDLFCRLLLSFVSQGVGRYLLFSPVSFEFCYWVAVELIFLQSMKFTPGPVQYSSFLLLWHLLPSAPLTLLAPHLCSAGHRSMALGDSEVTRIESGALLHGRIRGLFSLGWGGRMER